MEYDSNWHGFLNLIEGQVRWQDEADKNGFFADLRVELRRDQMVLFFGSATRGMDYKGPEVKSLFERVSQSRKGDK